MAETPSKPDGEIADDGTPSDIEQRGAIRNQGEVKPEDYPEPAAGEQVRDGPNG